MRKLDEILGSEKIWEYELMPFASRGGAMHGALVKLPDCGTSSVIWGDNEHGMEHVSVSPKKKFRTPTWDDMCALKDIFFDSEEEVYQIHPKASEYVNIRGNCLHLWKPIGHDLGELAETRERSGWIPVNERLPESEGYVMVSFSNYTLPDIARYEIDKDGSGAFYPGDEEFTYITIGVFVNAWMPLPEPYREER